MDRTRTWRETEPGVGNGYWLAAVIPGFNENPDVAYSVSEPWALYGSRVLSDSGRLFFDSADALVSGDVNGREDVYQYEPDGVGGCGGGPGCVALISSGQGSDDSTFVDASIGGGDVFFTTSDRLVPADKDHAADLYDAHVCTSWRRVSRRRRWRLHRATRPMGAVPHSRSSRGCSGRRERDVLGCGECCAGAGGQAAEEDGCSGARGKLAKALKVCRRKREAKGAGCEALASKRYGPRRLKAGTRAGGK